MSDKQYHHGDLRNALIETGIKMISEQGEEKLSLRKLAAACGVSSAAPYSHFSGKEDMLHAMQEYITEQFMDYLQAAINKCKVSDGDEALVALGKAYVLFFIQNPDYYRFLFSKDYIKVNLSIKEETKDNYPPFELLKNLYLKVNKKKQRKLSMDEQELEIIHLWACVQGIASIAFMENVTWDKKWEDGIERLIR